MQRNILILIILFQCMIQPLHAQQSGELLQLNNYSFPVYYSPGQEERAVAVSARVEKAMAYLQTLVEFKPAIKLYILDEAHWNKYSAFPVVYGMAHFDIDKLVVAAEDNAFWRSFVPAKGQIPATLEKKIENVYKTKEGNISMQGFFDLLAIHELGHAFHDQGGLNMQRKWLGELFVNIMLHTYIAENEPEQLPALTVFPRMVVEAGSKEFKYTRLQDADLRYDELGKDYPRNYGWYQCRWHMEAGHIYDVSGKAAVTKIWTALKNQQAKLGDEELIHYVETSADKTLANMIVTWDATIRK